MYCRYCGEEIRDDSTFCSGCGQRLAAAGGAGPVETPLPGDRSMPDELGPPPDTPPAGAGEPPVAEAEPEKRPRRTGRAALCVLLVVILMAAEALALVLALRDDSSTIREGTFDSPEAAITHFFECLREEDLAGVLSTFAIDSVAENYDLAAYLDRMQTVNYSMNLFPTEYPLYVDMHKIALSNAAQRGLMNLLSCITLEDELLEQVTRGVAATLADLDVTGEQYAEAIVPQAMDTLELLDLTATYSGLEEEAVSENMLRQVAPYGADGGEYWAACFSHDGQLYITGFTMINYGDNWLILNIGNALVGMSVTESAVPIDSIEVFQEVE